MVDMLGTSSPVRSCETAQADEKGEVNDDEADEEQSKITAFATGSTTRCNVVRAAPEPLCDRVLTTPG